jgi:hypothetical protein
MPDSSKKFHDFALRSILFKGRSDWYFCYLKAEKLAHALYLLIPKESEGSELTERAGELPQSIAYLAAGEADAAAVLADVFGILSTVRLEVTKNTLNKETGAVLCKEYEAVAERLMSGSHPSPFVSSQDFELTALPELEAPRQQGIHLKDISDTHRMSNKVSDRVSNTPASERMSLILGFIQKSKRASIKEIAAVVKGCSEKTIQRELGVLIERGLVRKEGERRWSVYLPA